MKRHSESALDLAEWLEKRGEVIWVNYPGLKNSKYFAEAEAYLPKGQSGLITFGVKGGYDSARKIADGTKIFSLLANIGDSKSLIIHPASTTHQQLDDAAQQATGVTKDLIRLSVGLENLDDLKADLEQAFATIDKSVLA
jgi:O-acetylhomoserine (thiol)-lyase